LTIEIYRGQSMKRILMSWRGLFTSWKRFQASAGIPALARTWTGPIGINNA